MLSFWHEVTLILYFCCLQPSYLSDNRTLLVLGCLHEFWRSPPRNVPSLFSVFSVLTLPISRFWQYTLFIFAGISSRLRILRCRQHLVCGQLYTFLLFLSWLNYSNIIISGIMRQTHIYDIYHFSRAGGTLLLRWLVFLAPWAIDSFWSIIILVECLV